MNSALIGLAAFAYIGVIVLVLRLFRHCPKECDE